MKVYACPAAVKVPDFMDSMVNGRFDMEKNDKADEQFFADLRAHLLANGYSGPLTGELVYFGYADGSAVYMVADAPRNTCLIHCPIGDAWSLPEWQTRGLTKKDIKDRLSADRRLSKMFGAKP